tara:strand:+ start:1245 stop:5216 length:3972 start_codon:yes stop_codon:yes gene_type:complete
MKFISSFKLKIIYVFRINNSTHLGCLKVGEATMDLRENLDLQPNSKALNQAAKKRINQYTQTAGISYDLLYTGLASYLDNGIVKTFTDRQVHKVLIRSGLKRKYFDTERKANEWFIADLETIKKAVQAVKNNQSSLSAKEITTKQNPIIFRPEQKAAIKKTIQQFKKGNEMLWFAKMRFGKTISALQVIKEHEFKRTLIFTHRPVVDKGWFEDFGKIFYDRSDFMYGSKNKGNEFDQLEKQSKSSKNNYVYFASIQDLRGSELVGGNFDKNHELFNAEWDFLIIDEAHEGTQTELGKNVLDELKKVKTKLLFLSGTPFNLLQNYKEEEIYTWDYVMEQKAKLEWDLTHFGDPNPYSTLPKLNIYTYNLGDLIKKFSDEELAFNFKEFFRTNDAGEFIHYKEVLSFLNLLCKKDEVSNYPFSTEEYRNNFRHSLWMLPGVKEAKALSKILKSHSVFNSFEIVNVAGDGDEEEENLEALKKVEKAISNNPDETYSITLSCGRLTTGVSVKAWTAVFMLSGSYNTSAANYMQTIFRVQTPATINGKIKEECYVFDFAPDRTLKVIAETAKVSAKAGKTSVEDRKIMGEFLNFCPIISLTGSEMRKYDVNGMLEQLKKVYVERVVNNGFEDGYLYNNDELMKLKDVDLEEFKGLKKIIGSTKSMGKSSNIDINNQGFTDEEYEQLEKIKKKNKRKLTEEEKKLIAERKEKKKNRDSAISILKGISIRMPLMIYGASIENENQELTIDNFTKLIDNESWNEFMPKGVDKLTFNRFKKYYEPDIFRAAGKKIRSLTRAADYLTVEERISRITSIFSSFRNPDKETVLTPWKVVNKHLGSALGGFVFLDHSMENVVETPRNLGLGEVQENIFHSESRILEINSKSGLYPLYVSYSLYRARLYLEYPNKEFNSIPIEDQHEIWDKTVKENVFVICKTPMAKSITKRTLIGFRKSKVNTHYFEDLSHQITNRSNKFIEKIKKGESYWKAIKNNNMKFDAIVGNPPYQDINENTSDTPIYNLFMDISFQISSRVTFITPARFLFNAGKTPKDWNKKMLNDNHFKVVWYESKSTNVFPNVDIKGGVAVTLRDTNQSFGKIGAFSAHKELSSICNKVTGAKNFEPLSEIIHLQNKFNLNVLYKDYPKFREIIGSNGQEKRLTTPIFTQLDVFSDEPINKGDVRIFGLIENRRVYRWIPKEYLLGHENFDKYKVLVTAANGTGQLGEILSTPVVMSPNTGFTFSFISFGSFDSKNAADALLKYLKTKFTRTLLGVLKVTQHNLPSTWMKIPLQDFTTSSDIEWSKSVAEIDEQLFLKYKLDNTEIEFIHNMIKPMK